jgi:hypothetical protein
MLLDMRLAKSITQDDYDKKARELKHRQTAPRECAQELDPERLGLAVADSHAAPPPES